MSEHTPLPDEAWQVAMPRYWCADDAFETRFLEAMSLIAPEVERFVIGAVHGGLSCPGAQASETVCRTFILEEAEHSRVHHGFNRRLALQGIDTRAALAPVRAAANAAKRWLPRGGQLAAAAACEHLSALLSLTYLRAARKSTIQSDGTARLFERHARDELGHRAVVFDLLRSTGGGAWGARAAALVAVSCIGVVCALRVVDALLRYDVPKRRAAVWWRGAKRLLAPGRWISPTALLGGWLAYLRPGFHPAQLPGA
jgi:predicted metal-dependent hydrolase